MSKSLKLVSIIIAVSGFALAQGGWTYVEDFKLGSNPHGVVVDGNGRIWLGFYAYTDTLGLPDDTIRIAPIYVFEPNGDHASFSPIQFLTIGGVTDTIATFCRGLSLDNNGNVLFTGNQVLYRINYMTGEGMQKYVYPYASGSLTEAASDANGFTYLTKVVPGGDPTVILDDAFDLYDFVMDSTFTIQRSIVVSPNGNDVYIGTIYSGDNGVRHYHSDDGPDGTYALVDTLGTTYDNTGAVVMNMWAQCLDWDADGNLWVGTYWDVGANDFMGWYALDPDQDWMIVDSIGANAGNPTTDPVPPVGGTFYSPRGIAFSADGMTAYTADFDGGAVKKWSSTVSIDPEIQQVPVTYRLFQNYPNPFNPTTLIPFEILESGLVNLTVFDMLGREVSTLIKKRMDPGHYEVLFDATGLAAGMYIYKLEMDFKLASKRMMYVK